MYQVLARKYRPKNFYELVGQSHVSTALTNAIDHQRLHHAYLFTGTRGVGKTTIARILAKCLNCETGVTSQPCGICSTCVAIDAGRFIDLIEIDAASRTKVEDTREILDNVPYAPSQGRYKVYLIDEVHMLSTHSFNALLKTLEEPPEHVKFLLATTDPQKLPITIISRCLQFVLRPIAQTMLADYLAIVLQKEQIPATPDALWQLASSAKGSVRDALSLTDQAIAFGNGQIQDDTVTQMLGLIDQTDVAQLLQAILEQNTQRVGQMLVQMREQVVDAKAVFDSLVEILHDVAVLQILPTFNLPLNQQQQQARTYLATHMSADTVQLYYEILVQSREKIALANTPLQALEMGILRLLAFRPLALAERPQVLESYQPTHSIEPTDPVEIAEETLIPALSPNAEVKSELGGDLVPESIAPSSSKLPEIMPDAESNFAPNPTSSPAPNQTLNPTPIYQSDQQAVYPQNEPPFEPTVTPETRLQSPSVNTPPKVLSNADAIISTNESITHTPSEDSPLTLLVPLPQTLTGEWTPQKWDYWVYQARENGWLAEDELVLAKRGSMVGQIDGQCEFITAEQVLANSPTFMDLQHQLSNHFPQLQLSLRLLSQPEPQLIRQLPEQQQAQREALALAVATEKISQTPVIRALLNEQASLDYVRLAK